MTHDPEHVLSLRTLKGRPRPPHQAQFFLTRAETVCWLALSVLVFVPLWVVSMFRPGAFVATAVGVLIALLLVRRRHVVVGQDFLAVRQLWRYRYACHTCLTHMVLTPTEHGGTLHLHTSEDGRLRLRRSEWDHPHLRAALQAMVSASAAGSDPHARHAVLESG